jgi:hypothetical protein
MTPGRTKAIMTVGVLALTVLVVRSAVPAETSLPTSVIAEMKQYSWRAGCPVPLDALRLVTVAYWGFDGQSHGGELLVHKEVAHEIVEIFKELYQAKFPIERMRRIEAYQGSDDASMADDNTSAFNCRMVTGSTSVFSPHAWGKAIDINPRINPYVKKNVVLPSGSDAYTDRTQPAPGLIQPDSVCTRIFLKWGWRWGGAWSSMKDYQHFEKRK